MVVSTSARCNVPTTSSHCNSEFCSLRLNWKHNELVFATSLKRRGPSLKIIKSVLDNRNSSISDNGATEPARILLERLFAQTQKLEEQMNRDSRFPQDVHFGLNLEILESDLEAALVALKKKEEELQDAERIVFMEHSELNRAKQELEQWQKEVDAARCKYEKIEDELKLANLNLASQARQMEDLKLQIKERDHEIGSVQYVFSLKEEEMGKMRNELLKKSEEAVKIDSELKSKAQLLNEANKVVKKQEIELLGLRKVIQDKEEALQASLTYRKLDEEKVKVAESNLEKRTMEWLLAQEELKKLAEEASKQAGEANETLEDFRRVKRLLSDVRSELVSSQKSLASSREKMEEQDQLLEKQKAELEEQKKSIMSYMTSLKDAQVEIDCERAKLRVAETRNKELERDLSTERELVEELQEELKKERSSLELAMQELSSLQEELVEKNNEFEEMHNLLQVKESELVEAKLEIKHLKSDQATLELLLDEKDLELSNARNGLEEVNKEIVELKMLLNSKEDQLIQATTMLKEKDEHVQIMENELNNTKQNVLEAETVVERILDLTNKLVISVKVEDYSSSGPVDDMGHELLQQLLDKPSDDFRMQKKRLETELESTRDSLRRKEMDVLAAQRSLAVKDEELKLVLGRLEAQGKELGKMKEEMADANDLKKLYALAQESIGEKRIEDLATEKLQLEAAQLEVEAATSALYKLTEMSRELLNKATVDMDVDIDSEFFPKDGFDSTTSVVENNEYFTLVTTEVSQLSGLTEQLVKEAGIAVSAADK